MLNLAITALYVASLVEVFAVARLGVRALMPEQQPVKHGARYRGVHTEAAYRYRLAAESNRTA